MKKAIAVILSILLVMAITLPTAAVSTITVKSIKLSNSKITLEVGKTSNLKVTFIPANTSQKMLTYVTGNKKIATVNTTGQITGISKGTTTITVYTLNKKIFAKVNVTISAIKVVKLDIFSASTASTTAAGVYDNTWWGKIIKEKVGVSLNFLPTGDQATEKLQALMASGELPDLVIFKTTKDVQNAIRGNMLVNLDKHLDKLPNVKMNASTALQYSRDNISNNTGKAYSVNNSVGPAEVLGSEPSWGPYIRWDLYKKIGSPAINTYDDYLTVLKKMQDLEPKTSDGKKAYGITLWKDWDNYSLFLATELGATNGIDCGDQLGQLPFLQVDFKNGKTKNIIDADSQYIKALNFYYKANQMGLVDPDSLTQTWATAKSKLTEGRVYFSWWSWYSDNYNTLERMNADTPTGFAAVLPKDSKTLIPCDNKIGKNWPFAISSSTKNLDACLKFVDFMYSTDGLQEWVNGPKGTIWDLDTSGKPKITEAGWKYVKDLNLPLPQGDVFHNDGLMVGSLGLSTAFINPKTQEPINYKLWTSSKKHEIVNQTKLQQDWTKVTGYQTTLDYVKAKNMVMEIPLAQSLIPSMTDDISAMTSRVGDIVKTYSWKMIFAKDDAEYQSLYNDMKTKAEGLGLKDVYDWSVKGWNQAQDGAKKYK